MEQQNKIFVRFFSNIALIDVIMCGYDNVRML
jgi:hypothetical protein